jgi:hypothetical protein
MIDKLYQYLSGNKKNAPATPEVRKTESADDLPEDIKKEYDKYMELIPNLLLDERAAVLAKKLVNRFLVLVWDLPASEDYHHAEPFGLFIHSLESAVNNVKLYQNKLLSQFKDGAIDSYEIRIGKPYEQSSQFLKGLLSDIGEAAKCYVSTDNWKKSESEKVDCMVKYFADVVDDFPRDAETQAKLQTAMKIIPDITSQALDVLKNDDDRNNNDADILTIDYGQVMEMYSHFVSGLLHDIGKAAEFVVSSDDKKWCPVKEGLYHFIQRHSGIVKREGLANKTYDLHKKLIPFFASRILVRNDYNFMGAENFADIISGKKFSTTAKADMQSTLNNTSGPSANIDIAKIAELFLKIVKNLLSSGEVILNSRMPGAWVMEDFTAVAYSIFEVARIEIQNIGYSLTPPVLIKALTKNGKYVKVEDGWRAIYTMSIETDGGVPFQYTVLQFRNAELWSDIKKPDICRLNLKFSTSKK